MPSVSTSCRCIGTSWMWCGWWCSSSSTLSGAKERNRMAVELASQTHEKPPDAIEMPAPTAWPIALAFGITLLCAGLVTSEAVSILGAIVAVAGAVGWFRAVLPHEAHELEPVTQSVPGISTIRKEVARIEIDHGLQRGFLPLEIYPISAGIKGGLAG